MTELDEAHVCGGAGERGRDLQYCNTMLGS